MTDAITMIFQFFAIAIFVASCGNNIGICIKLIRSWIQPGRWRSHPHYNYIFNNLIIPHRIMLMPIIKSRIKMQILYILWGIVLIFALLI